MTGSPIAVAGEGIDYSGLRPQASAVKAAGAQFVIRYSAGIGDAATYAPSTKWKLAIPGELKASIAAGYDFIGNSELYGTRVTEGAAAGLADGKADYDFWRSEGYNKNAAIYVSYDAAPDPKAYDQVKAYLDAYRKGVQYYYRLGLYGGTPVLRAMLASKTVEFTWRSNASSWSNDGLPYQPLTLLLTSRQALVAKALLATPANLWQTGNYWFQNQADENLVLRLPCGSHLQNAPAPPPPPAPTPVPADGFVYPPGDAGQALYDAVEVVRSALLPGYVPANQALVTHFGPIMGQALLGRTVELEATVQALQTQVAALTPKAA